MGEALRKAQEEVEKLYISTFHYHRLNYDLRTNNSMNTYLNTYITAVEDTMRAMGYTERALAGLREEPS